jgi:hypothetical protein
MACRVAIKYTQNTQSRGPSNSATNECIVAYQK